MTRYTVLTYHVIDRPRDGAEADLCCPPERFREQILALRAQGYEFAPLATALEAANGHGAGDDHKVVITIDDGFTCALEHAAPILAELKVPATVFVVAGMLGGPARWLREDGLPVRNIVSAAQLRALTDAGITIGSHTVNHLRLDECPADVLHTELADSRRILEDAVGHAVNSLAYPYGRHNRRVRDAAEAAGYSSAYTGIPGIVAAGEDPLLTHRISATGNDANWQLRGKVWLGTNDMPPLSLGKRLVKRTLARAGRTFA